MKTSIYVQHDEHLVWLKKLSVYVDEITMMQNRLEKSSAKNFSLEARKEIEHFQNQIFIQTRAVDEMKRHIKRDEKVIMANMKHNPAAPEHRTAEDHKAERESMESFEYNFANLRKEFNEFITKCSTPVQTH
jgi:hypothetical protein